ncbi:MAG: Na(+)-translocating NADH-quinone reductase subunit A [Pseudomonadota bacterium]
MKEYHLKRGLDLPIEGQPIQQLKTAPDVRAVGLLGDDYLGLKPRLAVEEGDRVGAGAPIFAHKDTPTAPVTTPISGRIAQINRGFRRRLVSVVVERDDTAPEPLRFDRVGNDNTSAGVIEKLCAAGLWSSFRTRPYSKVPDPASRPAALFVTALDTEPLAPDPTIAIESGADAFARGLHAVAALYDVPTYLCQAPGERLPGGDAPGVTPVGFSGPHPAGLAGTHIHFLHPPSAEHPVWTVGYQDVIAIGHLLTTGTLRAERVVALGGPLVKSPRLIRTLAGASLRDVLRGEYDDSVSTRLISGSVLSGRASRDGEAQYLGRYAQQITVIEEDRQQNVLGWIRPMPSKYAVQPVLGSALSKKRFPLTSNLNGGRRAMVPLGTFEELMPQDFLPTQLLRALLVMDTDVAQALGALELDEEDVALAGFACPAKYEYGLALRDCLTRIEKEG